MSANSWFEKGELPPVGAEVYYESEFFTTKKNQSGHCEIIAYHDNKVWMQIIRGIDHCINLNVIKFRPAQTEKTIDMTKLAGTDVLMRGRLPHSGLFIAADKNVIHRINDEDAVPVYEYWNHITGLTEEPEWLEGFEYVVKEVCGYMHGLDMQDVKGSGYVDWNDVIAIKITGLKDGWVYD